MKRILTTAHLDLEQLRTLRHRRLMTGVSASETIREALDEYFRRHKIKAPKKQPPRPRKRHADWVAA